MLPASFEFARSIARLYLTNLCKAATSEPGVPIPEIPPPVADLERAVLQAPPMTGLEYLTPEVLAELVAGPRFSHPGRDREAPRRSARISPGAQPPVAIRRPRDAPPGREQAGPRLPVRVSGHVCQRSDTAGQGEARTPGPGASAVCRGAEPRGDAESPAPDLEGRRILGIDPAARRFRARSITPSRGRRGEAYEFLKAIPLLESSGLIVRVPDWWNAQKPTRPRVSVKINSKNSAGIGVDAMMEFSVGVSLDGETLSPEEIAQLLEASGGLVPLKGKWVEVDREKLQEALKHWKDVERDVRREGISFFEGMRLLSGANLAKEDEDEQPGGDSRMVGPDRRPGIGFDPPGPAFSGDPEGDGPSRFEGGASPLSADGLRLVAIRRSPGTGSLSGRRHGPRQDDPGDFAAPRSEARQAEKAPACSSCRLR